jgi:hypothetical protein
MGALAEPRHKGQAWVIALLALLGALVMLVAWQPPAPAVVLAAPNVFSGPVNGGCYLATATTCRLHVDSWQPLAIAPGARLLAFQLQANGQLLYDFHTDVSNPPAGSYLPSLVKKDFAARCGESYVLSVLAQDTGDVAPVAVGQTNTFTCPVQTQFDMYIAFVAG